MIRPPVLLALLVATLGVEDAATAQESRPDRLVADFEGPDYGSWTVEGAAFGTAPARGTLPGQMDVTGFEGKGLVSSFVGGDGSTGSLASPPFTIERRFLNFLIGGGRHPGETCFNLEVDGQLVRTATGPNDRPGGTERLEAASWDVADLQGKSAVLRVVDRATGGWGHVNVDQIVQSDTNRGLQLARRELRADARYLHLPVDQDAPVRRVKVLHGAETVREFDIRLGGSEPDFRVFLDLKPFAGQTLALEVPLPADGPGLDALAVADEVPGASDMYQERDRPQFHFTARRGWLNDPNGLVFDGKQYHLYFQHNPYGWEWGNMHWGHASSPDLVHWTEHPEALTPRTYGDWCFSGSAVVDRGNTSGFGTPEKPPLVLAYTSTGRGECIAYSRDNGMTWTEFEGNPVVKHNGRDPRLLWYAPGKHWVMAVYDETDGRVIDFHTSPDLKRWTFASRIGGFFECPDLVRLPIDGNPEQTAWVLYAADGKYLVGQFDGRTFTPSTSEKLQTWHGNFYAAQTYSDEPKGRIVQVGWGQGIAFPGMPFNQQMTVPVELSLNATPEGPRLLARPVAELEALRWKSFVEQDFELGPEWAAPGDAPELADVELSLEVGSAQRIELSIRGTMVAFDVARGELSCGDVRAPLAPAAGRLNLRVLRDRGSVEVFGNGGRVALSVAARGSDTDRSLRLSAIGGKARVRSLTIHTLEPAWPR